MILHLMSSDRKTIDHYDMNSEEDMASLFAKFPRTREIIQNGLGEQEQAKALCAYLSNHWAKAWVEPSSLLKSDTRRALMIAATTAAIGIVGIADQALAANFGTQPEDKFLWTTMQIESSNGKNTEHRLMKTGLHAGERAVGRWGLMPKTIAELDKRFRLSTRFPLLKNVTTLDNEKLAEFFEEKPEAELIVARALARHVLRTQQNNLAKAAYSWLHGHNLAPEKITAQMLSKSDYVEKFAKADESNPFRTASEREKFKNKMKGWMEANHERNMKLRPDKNKGFDRGYAHKEDKTPKVKEKIMAMIRRKDD